MFYTLEKIPFGETITLNKKHSPCSLSFEPGTRIFIEFFDLRSRKSPDNFVLLAGEQIPFHSNTLLRKGIEKMFGPQTSGFVLTLTRPIGLLPHTPVVQKIADQR